MPGADSNDLFQLYRYDPSMTAAILFIILFLAISALHLYQLVVTKTWFFVSFVIGGFTQWIGYIGRAVSAGQSPNWTVNPYIIQTLLLLVSPTLFSASIYMILGRVILLTGGEPHSIIRSAWLTKLFVLGDVLSFVLHGAGGGIMASGTLEALEKGERIVIVGLIIQVLFFSLFSITAAVFHVRLVNAPTQKILSSDMPWQMYLWILYTASGPIMVRSIFRLIEYAQGNMGYLISHEVYLYIFDGLLMFLTMALFAWYHPSEINARLRRGGRSVKRGIQIQYQS